MKMPGIFFGNLNMYKLEHYVDGAWIEHSHPKLFDRHKISSGTERICAGVPSRDYSVFPRLVNCLKAPFFLLYVLHTSRGEGEIGRYQSPELSADQLEQFLAKYKSLLAQDSRFDIWVYSPQEEATIVWDRHNMLFAYGVVDVVERELIKMEFERGSISMDFDHIHCYRSACDNMARQLLGEFQWRFSPLRPQDEQ